MDFKLSPQGYNFEAFSREDLESEVDRLAKECRRLKSELANAERRAERVKSETLRCNLDDLKRILSEALGKIGDHPTSAEPVGPVRGGLFW